MDETALIDALNEGRLAGAALDVFAEEPIPPGHPLWTTKNLFITPHIAADSPVYMHRAFSKFEKNYRLFRTKRTMESTVDLINRY